jgi:hypothetical protein
MVRKIRNNRIKKYTAFVPKTMRATQNTGKKIINKINLFLVKTNKTVKKTTKMLNKRAASSIRSFTKKRILK